MTKTTLIISILFNIAAFGFIVTKRHFSVSRNSELAIGVQQPPAISTSTMLRTDKLKIRKIKRVLVLGNSIVKHPPLPSIGWNNNWGMAASSIDSDFVHILIRDIKKKDSGCKIMFENIADFERDFDTYDFKQAQAFKDFKPDLIVMRICENVNADKAVEKGFIKYYDSLLTYIDPKAPKVVISGFWRNNEVNRMLHDYAYLKGFSFIDQTSICSNETKAIGQYKDSGIQEHPNNLGMRKIEQSIWNAISIYF